MFERNPAGPSRPGSSSTTNGSSVTHRPDFSPGCVVTIDSHDVDDASEQTRRFLGTELMQLEGGEVHVAATIVALGETLLVSARYSRRLLTRGAAPTGCVTLLLNASDSVPTRIGSRPIDARTCAVNGSGAEICNYAPRDTLPMTIAVSEEKWCEWMSGCVHELRLPLGQTQILTANPRSVRRLTAHIDTVCGMAAARPARLRDAIWAGCLEDAVLAATHGMLDSSAIDRPLPSERIGRHRAVARARGFIHERLAETISLARLCRVSHAAARTLEYGFRELFEVSPITYVRCARLARVHKALHDADREPVQSVTDVATHWGFCHLGQFSIDYRIMFGESPSTTLAHARHQSARVRQAAKIR
jgi:AraC-like DNA-binding protein